MDRTEENQTKELSSRVKKHFKNEKYLEAVNILSELIKINKDSKKEVKYLCSIGNCFLRSYHKEPDCNFKNKINYLKQAIENYNASIKLGDAIIQKDPKEDSGLSKTISSAFKFNLISIRHLVEMYASSIENIDQLSEFSEQLKDLRKKDFFTRTEKRNRRFSYNKLEKRVFSHLGKMFLKSAKEKLDNKKKIAEVKNSLLQAIKYSRRAEKIKTYGSRDHLIIFKTLASSFFILAKDPRIKKVIGREESDYEFGLEKYQKKLEECFKYEEKTMQGVINLVTKQMGGWKGGVVKTFRPKLFEENEKMTKATKIELQKIKKMKEEFELFQKKWSPNEEGIFEAIEVNQGSTCLSKRKDSKKPPETNSNKHRQTKEVKRKKEKFNCCGWKSEKK